MNSNETCTHCEETTGKIMVTGKRVIENETCDTLFPNALCRTCNEILRSSSHKTYNNAPNANMENTRQLFWEKVDTVLQRNNIQLNT